MAGQQVPPSEPKGGRSRLCRLRPRVSAAELGLGISVRRCWSGWLLALAMLSAAACTGTARAASYDADDGAALETAVARADASSAPSTIILSGGVFLPSLTLHIGGNVTIVGP